MDNQTELLETINQNFDIYQNLIPDVGQAYDALPSEVYKDGELKDKIKRLMGLAASLTHGCRRNYPGCAVSWRKGIGVTDMINSVKLSIQLYQKEGIRPS